MATARTYGDGCSIAQALDLVGDRWALLIVRELLLGSKRYTDLRGGLPNVSPNVLSERLRELEQSEILRRRTLPPPTSARVYELTPWGLELEDVVVSLGRWPTRSPVPRHTDAPVRSADSVALALRAEFDPGAAEGLSGLYELRIGADRFRVAVASNGIELDRGSAERPDATFEGDADALTAVFLGGRSLAAARRSKQLTVTGDGAAAERFVGVFRQ